ncbi:sporulation phosphorelay system protein KapB [Paenibacillus sp. GYB003]|uniref:sporulation phosphorelay system protein KapB n=1 Tax=Paenibacillus sp. GYB003 TaxID=2994392 RepID=UPI002F96A483
MNTNDYVTVDYKTGVYIAKIVEAAPARTLVEIAAVIRHPLQGDLHRPYEPDVPMFHERRAAAHREKVWVPSSSVERYEGGVPDYGGSLRQALDDAMRAMTGLAEGEGDSAGANDRPGLSKWAERALANLRRLERDYFG